MTNPRLSPLIRDSNATVVFTPAPEDDHPGRVGIEGEAPPTPWAFGALAEVPKGATDVEVRRHLGAGSAFDRTAVLHLDSAEDVFGGFEDAEAGNYIRTLLETKVLYGSWCCSRTNFHHPGATAFFERPTPLPVGAKATALRLKRGAR